MKRIPVNSSILVSVSYSSTNETLDVEFVNGSVHRYYYIPIEEFEGLLNAKSAGRYYNNNIRDSYFFDSLY